MFIRCRGLSSLLSSYCIVLKFALLCLPFLCFALLCACVACRVCVCFFSVHVVVFGGLTCVGSSCLLDVFVYDVGSILFDISPPCARPGAVFYSRLELAPNKTSRLLPGVNYLTSRPVQGPLSRLEGTARRVVTHHLCSSLALAFRHRLVSCRDTLSSRFFLRPPL